ncbi:hypothetical protein Hanom_Chr10g00888301 [Helianthus anomalus]
MTKSDPSIAVGDRSDHCHSYNRLQLSSRTFYMLMVEWQVPAAGGKWWRQIVVSECLCVCECVR